MLSKIFGTLWGDFSPAEAKKFTFLATIFGTIIGIYWTLRPLKDAIFMSTVGVNYLPMAKLVSVVAVFPIVILYSKVIDKFPRKKLFYVICGSYALMALILALFLANPSIGLLNKTVSPTRIIGWVWYVFIESFGSLIVSLFWAFAADTTKPESAKKGFYIVNLGAQLGQIIIPLSLTKFLPMLLRELSYKFNMPILATNVPVIFVVSFFILLIAFMVSLFIKVTPPELLVGYQAKEKESTSDKKKKTGFLEGLKLLFSEPYLLGIFAIVTIFEIVVTVIDFAFKSLVATGMTDDLAITSYLGNYAMWTGILSFSCIILGASNIQRKLGLSFTLALSPVLVGIAVLVMLSNPGLSVIFWIMVLAKGFNYALNQPSIQQLYIPTSKDSRYKAKAWSDMFGSRSAKAMGSTINATKKKFVSAIGPIDGAIRFLRISSYISLVLVVVWFIIAPILGRVCKRAVDKDETVC